MTDLDFKVDKFKRPPINDGLVLYFHPHSYYSQKVLLALHEKQIKFKTYEIDVGNGEQFSSWFLELNPKGEVPVLQNGSLIIPESSRILNYLEDNFRSENINRLLPLDINGKIIEKILYFSRKINKIPVGAITMGSLMHSEICFHPKSPFIGPVRNALLKTDENISNILRDYAINNPVQGDILLKKAIFQDMKRSIISNKDEFIKILQAIDLIFEEIEVELKLRNGEWFCCDKFTIADVSLAILLYRFSSIGLEKYYWIDGKRSYIEKYFQKIQLYENFCKSLPTTLDNWKVVWSKSPVSYKASVGVLSISSLLLAGSFVNKKH